MRHSRIRPAIDFKVSRLKSYKKKNTLKTLPWYYTTITCGGFIRNRDQDTNTRVLWTRYLPFKRLKVSVNKTNCWKMSVYSPVKTLWELWALCTHPNASKSHYECFPYISHKKINVKFKSQANETAPLGWLHLSKGPCPFVRLAMVTYENTILIHKLLNH